MRACSCEQAQELRERIKALQAMLSASTEHLGLLGKDFQALEIENEKLRQELIDHG